MKRRMSGLLFGVQFCVWVLTAVVGIGISLGTSQVLISPESVQLSNDDDPFGTPPKRSSAALWLALGMGMVLWPLPFCLGSASAKAVDGFGRE